jgi:hypothetical protein
LRFTRDKRGYENTYVVHAVRRRGKARQRILYWFRTPPNVRVGRAALDEDAIRLIEEHNPDIEFDWNKILEAQPPAPPPVEPRDRRRRARGGAATERERPSAAEPRRPPVAPPAAALAVSAVPPSPDLGPASDMAVTDSMPPDVADVVELEPPALVPVTVYHGGADVLVASVTDESPRQSPVEARLGSELLGRVRARYAEISARIREHAGADPARLEEMRRRAEELNPDAWVTEAEIVAGLQHFDARLGEIRRALGIKRRRRSRRGGRRRRGGGRERAPAAAGGNVMPTQSAASVREDEADEPGDDEAGSSPDDDEADSDDADPMD